MMRQKWIVICIFLAALLAACAQNEGAGKSGGDMAGHEWTLTEINGSPAITGRPVTLKIEDGQAGGSSGCNSYGGEAALAGTKISITNLVSTEMACMDPAGIMDQEAAYLQTLSQVASFTTAGTRLEFKNAAGETTLVFSR